MTLEARGNRLANRPKVAVSSGEGRHLRFCEEAGARGRCGKGKDELGPGRSERVKDFDVS